MSTLSEQIQERIARNGIVDRADLSLPANYDSIGRTLSQLVRDGKIVRIGRGRYQAIDEKAVKPTGSIVERKIGRSSRNVFLRSDFANSEATILWDVRWHAWLKKDASFKLVPVFTPKQSDSL